MIKPKMKNCLSLADEHQYGKCRANLLATLNGNTGSKLRHKHPYRTCRFSGKCDHRRYFGA